VKPILYGHWQIACAYGNHEQIYDGGGAVDMYVSYYLIFTPSQENFFKRSAKVGIKFKSKK
jgi:hypothetical protein